MITRFSVLACAVLTACAGDLLPSSTTGSTTATLPPEGGTGGSAGVGGETILPVGGAGGDTASTSSDPSPCELEACANIECGQVVMDHDCNGDGFKDSYLCADNCALPAICQGSYKENECGSACLSRPEYVDACQAFGNVAIACPDSCGYCYELDEDGTPALAGLSVACPKTTTGGIVIRCCVPGCSNDC